MFRVISFCMAMIVVQQAGAAVTIDIIENGGDVQATLSGSINTAALGASGGASGGYDGYSPDLGAIGFTGANTEHFFIGKLWTSIGSGTFDNWDSSSGDAWAMFTGGDSLGLPVGYISQSGLSATATKTGTSFAALGFTPGVYVTTLTNGQISDTVTVNVGPVVSVPVQPVPTISIWGLGILAGVLGLIGIRRRMK